jgi:hypothetical protein
VPSRRERAALTAYVAVNAARVRSRRGLAALTGDPRRDPALPPGPSLDARRSPAPSIAMRVGRPGVRVDGGTEGVDPVCPQGRFGRRRRSAAVAGPAARAPEHLR